MMRFSKIFLSISLPCFLQTLCPHLIAVPLLVSSGTSYQRTLLAIAFTMIMYIHIRVSAAPAYLQVNRVVIIIKVDIPTSKFQATVGTLFFIL